MDGKANTIHHNGTRGNGSYGSYAYDAGFILLVSPPSKERTTDNDGGRNYDVKVQLKQITIPIPLGSYFTTGTRVCTLYKVL